MNFYAKMRMPRVEIPCCRVGCKVWSETKCDVQVKFTACTSYWILCMPVTMITLVGSGIGNEETTGLCSGEVRKPRENTTHVYSPAVASSTTCLSNSLIKSYVIRSKTCKKCPTREKRTRRPQFAPFLMQYAKIAQALRSHQLHAHASDGLLLKEQYHEPLSDFDRHIFRKY